MTWYTSKYGSRIKEDIRILEIFQVSSWDGCMVVLLNKMKNKGSEYGLEGTYQIIK